MANGFILMGGESLRMGCDKASLLLDGEPLALYQAGKLAGLCRQVFLCGERGGDSLFGGVPWIGDQRPGRAAILGIEAALHATTEEWNVILAVDIPAVSSDFIRSLLQIANERDVAALCPSEDSGPHPLCSIWKKAALGPLRAQLEEGNLSVQAAIRASKGRILSERETSVLPGYAAGCLRNVNSRADWDAVCTWLKEEKRKEKRPGSRDPGLLS